jgi:UV DNA damage endonuclease
LVYDVHHHRCNGDGNSEEETTESAIATWPREPLFHLSSPIDGWHGSARRRHRDFIDVYDFPRCWLDLDLTVEVEAKAKELAVLKLKNQLQKLRGPSRPQSRGSSGGERLPRGRG